MTVGGEPHLERVLRNPAFKFKPDGSAPQGNENGRGIGLFRSVKGSNGSCFTLFLVRLCIRRLLVDVLLPFALIFISLRL